MIFGIEIQPLWIVLGGALVAALLAFQILEGLRIIRFKGPQFMKVHKGSAWAIAAFAGIHAFGALVYVFGWRIG